MVRGTRSWLPNLPAINVVGLRKRRPRSQGGGGSKSREKKVERRNDCIPLPGQAARRRPELGPSDAGEVLGDEHIRIVFELDHRHEVADGFACQPAFPGQWNHDPGLQIFQQAGLNIEQQREDSARARVSVAVQRELLH